jgi:hypothetical protein
MPEEFRTRVYQVTLTPTSIPPPTQFDMSFSNGVFDDLTLAWAAVAGRFVSIVFSDPGIIERVAPRTYLSYYADASVTVPDSPVTTISAPLSGQIDYCVLSSYPGSYSTCTPAAKHVKCESKNHQLTMTRR